MKRVIVLAIIILIAAALVLTIGGCKRETGSQKVVLVMGSWRADDVEQMNNLLAEYKKIAPNVTIRFQPTNPPDYNATLRLQLEGGTGPDLMYARSYATGVELFEQGFFADVTDIPGLLQNFTASNLAPWQTENGRMFAVPFAAVSQIVFYNKDIFAEHNLTVPNTWDEFIQICQTLSEAGITPLANGIADEWDILECRIDLANLESALASFALSVRVISGSHLGNPGYYSC